jgi:uncharacterized membrane protein YdbT with pleckstrin-like domain
MSYQFHGQRANENVLLVTRKHPFVLLRPFLISALILLIPIAVLTLFPVGLIPSLSIIVCIIVALLHAALAWHAWSNTTFLLTTERVVFLDRRSFFNRELVEAPLSGIRKVAHEVKGLLPTIFGYGNIAIYTSGSQEPIVIMEMPEPYEMQQEILRAGTGEGLIEDED